MKKVEVLNFIDFIEEHYDVVDQEDWFTLQNMILDVCIKEANNRGYAKELAEKYPYFFETVKD